MTTTIQTGMLQTVAVANGGTGATTAAAARTNLGAAASGANSDITSLTALASVNGGQLAGLRNKIINGNLGINQRGASSFSTAYSAGTYIMDRWKAGAGGCTLSFSTTNNATTVTITAGTLVQVIEGNNLQSGTHVLSWAGTAQGRIDSGSYGASGLTGTATGGANLSVEFGTGSIALVQLEPGSVATPFEHRPYGMELTLCQRYYEVLTRNSNSLNFKWYGPGGAGEVTCHFPWQAVKRTTPTITNSSADFINNCSAAFGDVSAYGYRIVMLSSSAGVGNFAWTTANPAASAEL